MHRHSQTEKDWDGQRESEVKETEGDRDSEPRTFGGLFLDYIFGVSAREHKAAHELRHPAIFRVMSGVLGVVGRSCWGSRFSRTHNLADALHMRGVASGCLGATFLVISGSIVTVRIYEMSTIIHRTIERSV